MNPEVPVLIDTEKLYGREVCDRVEEALGLVPWSFSIRDEIGIIHDYTFPFADSLRKKALDILQEPDGVQKLEEICTKTVTMLARGKETVRDTVLAFDQHIGTGMCDETVERSVDCYQRSSIDEAELYLREVGILEPAKKQPKTT